nr:helix-turn-helix domain-containing protein [uncultured Butyrivibrio sp.]
MKYEDIDWEIHDRLRSDRAEFQTSFTEEEKLAVYEHDMMTSRADIIDRIDALVSSLDEKEINQDNSKRVYYSRRKKCLIAFRNKIEKTILFNNLEPWWSYSIEVSSRGAKLFLEHAGNKRPMRDNHKIFTVRDTAFLLVDYKVGAMTIEEYAEYIGKSTGAVRQLLRRGKIRTAFKMGAEWRIPELTSPVLEKRFSCSSYKWDIELADVPNDFAYLRKPNLIEISRDRDNQKEFQLFVMHPEGLDSHYYKLSNEDREKLEFYLISNTYVTYIDDTCTFRYKKGDEEYEKREWT